MTEKNPAPVNAISDGKARSRAGGRPEYKPTDEQRKAVRELVAAGKPTRNEIAQEIGVSRATLRKHFAAELAKAPAEAPAAQLTLDGAAPAPNAVREAEVGRPEFEPNYRHREDVRLLKADGWSDDRIARRLGISPTTLRKHFEAELSDGADAVRLEALRNLMTASRKGNVSASNRLLQLSGLEPPPPPVKDEPPAGAAPAPPPEEPLGPDGKPLGKKDKALLAARTAEQGTSWHELMTDEAPAN